MSVWNDAVFDAILRAPENPSLHVRAHVPKYKEKSRFRTQPSPRAGRRPERDAHKRADRQLRQYAINKRRNPREDSINHFRDTLIRSMELRESALGCMIVNANRASSRLLGTTCSVCLELIEEKDFACLLKCGHAFHHGCIVDWISSAEALGGSQVHRTISRRSDSDSTSDSSGHSTSELDGHNFDVRATHGNVAGGQHAQDPDSQLHRLVTSLSGDPREWQRLLGLVTSDTAGDQDSSAGDQHAQPESETSDEDLISVHSGPAGMRFDSEHESEHQSYTDSEDGGDGDEQVCPNCRTPIEDSILHHSDVVYASRQLARYARKQIKLG